MKHVVTFSGGVSSWAAAKRVAARADAHDVVLLFADTLIEDEDLYRFLPEAAANVGRPVTRIADGRTPWEVFRDRRFIGNTRVDLCSRILKRELTDAWLAAHCDPAETTIHVGIDWSEAHRYWRLRARKAEQGWAVEAPLCDPPYLLKPDVLRWCRSEGLEPPRLYAMGFAHNNCGGFCVKAGMGHFAHLLKVMPERYAEHERQEQELRLYLGRDDIAILRDRTGGGTRRMTLREFRERVEAGQQIDLFDIGGCGCFSDVEDAA